MNKSFCCPFKKKNMKKKKILIAFSLLSIKEIIFFFDMKSMLMAIIYETLYALSIMFIFCAFSRA